MLLPSVVAFARMDEADVEAAEDMTEKRGKQADGYYVRRPGCIFLQATNKLGWAKLTGPEAHAPPAPKAISWSKREPVKYMLTNKGITEAIGGRKKAHQLRLKLRGARRKEDDRIVGVDQVSGRTGVRVCLVRSQNEHPLVAKGTLHPPHHPQYVDCPTCNRGAAGRRASTYSPRIS